MKMLRYLLGGWLLIGMSLAYGSLRIPVYMINGVHSGDAVGYIRADNTIDGLLLTPHLHGLPAGVHGFQVYECPFCQHHAAGAGGHWDPRKTDEHRGPYQGSGHLGDLPVLIVDEKGRATLPVLAPRLTLGQIQGRSVIIHAKMDNYSDSPVENGGEGVRLACGVVPYY